MAAAGRALGCCHFGFLENHHECPGGDERRADEGLGGDGFVEEEEGHSQGEDDTEFVNGHHLGHIAQLDGLVVAEPGGAGGKAGEHQEQPGLAGDVFDFPLGAHHEHHAPGHQEHHGGTDGGG